MGANDFTGISKLNVGQFVQYHVYADNTRVDAEDVILF